MAILNIPGAPKIAQGSWRLSTFEPKGKTVILVALLGYGPTTLHIDCSSYNVGASWVPQADHLQAGEPQFASPVSETVPVWHIHGVF